MFRFSGIWRIRTAIYDNLVWWLITHRVAEATKERGWLLILTFCEFWHVERSSNKAFLSMDGNHTSSHFYIYSLMMGSITFSTRCSFWFSPLDPCVPDNVQSLWAKVCMFNPSWKYSDWFVGQLVKKIMWQSSRHALLSSVSTDQPCYNACRVFGYFSVRALCSEDDKLECLRLHHYVLSKTWSRRSREAFKSTSPVPSHRCGWPCDRSPPLSMFRPS